MTTTDRRSECNVVFVGIRRDGCLGYFESSELPQGWTATAQCQQDISDIMESLRATKAEALQVMNAHWQR